MSELLPGALEGYIRAYLLILLLLCGVFHLNYSLNDTIWNEYDELANYDYIDKLTSGHLPRGDEYISDYSAEITFQHFLWAKTTIFDGSKQSMMAAGRSYQAQQPPLYFLLLTPLNATLKAAGVSPPLQIKLLRTVNVPLFLVAALLTIPIFHELSRLFGWNPIWGYYLAVLSYVFGYELRSHIGADNLSPLVGNAFIYLVLLTWRTRRQEFITWSALAASLCFLTKYTHALFPVMWAISTGFFYKHHPQPWRKRLLHAAPYSLVAAYFLLNAARYGRADPLGTGATKEIFAWIEPVLEVWHVLYYFVATALSLTPVFEYGNVFVAVILAILAVTYGLSFYRLFVEGKRDALPIFAACQVSVALILVALVLNAYRGQVYWFTFRIYFGYTLFWLFSLCATPLLLPWKWLRGAAGAVGLLLVTFLVYVRA